MALPITITDAGRAEIINAQNTGTGPVTITEIGFGTGQYTPTKGQLALQAQVKRVGSIAGQAVAADTIHVMAMDETGSAYNVGEFGLFSDKGTLIAVYSQPAASGWIIQKTGASTLLLATDIILESLGATTITFGEISFLNPPATTSVQGVVELATPEETQAGTDASRAVTPAGLKSLTASTTRAGLAQLNDTLTSNSNTQALTAAQGKKLQDEKQPLDATLTALAGLVSAVNQMIYATGVDTFAMTPLTAFMRTLLDDADAATARATLGAAPLASPAFTGTPTAPTPAAGNNSTLLANTAFVQAAIAALVGSSPGTLDTLNELAAALGDDPNFATTMATALAGKQPLDATLTALSSLTSAVNQMIYATGVDTFAMTPLTAFMRTLLDDADAATARATLGSNDASNLNAGTVGISLLPTAVRNLAQGSSAQDPNTATEPVILTNHANSPGQGLYWHITTTFYSAISGTANRGQIAVSYNGSKAQMMVRHHFSGAWTDWERCDGSEVAPPGAVMHFARSTAPTGWLKANGAAVSRTAYAGLFAAIGTTFGVGDGSTTFNLPDMRGEFLRGWDDARGVDSGRGFGTWQDSDNKSHTHTASTGADAHTHTWSGTTSSNGDHTHTIWRGKASGNTSTSSQHGDNMSFDGTSSAAGDHTHTVSGTTSSDSHTHVVTVNAAGGVETRPRNRALLICIKY